MPVGRRLAYDSERGRLWVVCGKCHEWSLIPLEERWEALEECERLFQSSDVRVAGRAPSATVALAKVGDVELLRLGDAPRDEIANARYGPRLLRREAHRRRVMTVAGIAAGGVAGSFILAGVSTGSGEATVFLAGMGLAYAVHIGDVTRRFRLTRFHRDDGSAVWLTASLLQTAVVPERQRRGHQLGTDLVLWNGRREERFYHDGALAPLAAILPALNAEGGSPSTIASAVKMVDGAEEAVRREARSATELHDRAGRAAWQRLLQGGKGAEPVLWMRPTVDRLALEMAVAEEVERRALAEDASSAGERAARESEVAAIADDMFLPRFVLDWLDRYKGRTRSTR